MWRQPDDALRSPQHWGIHHYALELEDAALIARRVQDPTGPVGLFGGGSESVTDHRHLGGVNRDLGVEPDRDGVVDLAALAAAMGPDVALVSLSTTLATNALVEGQGARVAVQTPNWETMVIPNSVLMKNKNRSGNSYLSRTDLI